MVEVFLALVGLSLSTQQFLQHQPIFKSLRLILLGDCVWARNIDDPKSISSASNVATGDSNYGPAFLILGVRNYKFHVSATNGSTQAIEALLQIPSLPKITFNIIKHQRGVSCLNLLCLIDIHLRILQKKLQGSQKNSENLEMLYAIQYIKLK